MDAADEKVLYELNPTSERAYTLSEAEEVDLDGLTVVLEEGQELGRPFVTLRAGTVAAGCQGETIAESLPSSSPSWSRCSASVQSRPGHHRLESSKLSRSVIDTGDRRSARRDSRPPPLCEWKLLDRCPGL